MMICIGLSSELHGQADSELRFLKFSTPFTLALKMKLEIVSNNISVTWFNEVPKILNLAAVLQIQYVLGGGRRTH